MPETKRPSEPGRIGDRKSDLLDPEAHILIVDDDVQIRQLIGRFLSQYGYRISGARDGREMRDIMLSARIDLVILDIMLPGVSGLDLCRELRLSSNIPIIMLTARDDDADRIVGLELGADDYVPKPFNPRELLARIRAVFRRVTNPPESGKDGSTSFQFAGWTLDTRRRELTSPSAVVVDLSSGEFELLLAFIGHPQRVLSRDQLLELTRQRAHGAFDRSIDVQVSRLRRKIDTEDSEVALIKTIRGVGYLFTPTVSRV